MTLLQKIQNITWWTLDIKLKDILIDLFGRVEILEESGGGGTQDLQSVLDNGNTAIDLGINLENTNNSNYVEINSNYIQLDNPSTNQYIKLLSDDIQDVNISIFDNNISSILSIKKDSLFWNNGSSSNELVLNRTSSDNATYSFPEKPVGTYTLATLDDIQAPLPTYTDNAAAIVGGLETDKWYKTATGELRVVV